MVTPSGPAWYVEEAAGQANLRGAAWPDFDRLLTTPFLQTTMTRLEYRAAVAAATGIIQDFDGEVSVLDWAVDLRGACRGSVEMAPEDTAALTRCLLAVLESWDPTGEDDFDRHVKEMVREAVHAGGRCLAEMGNTELLDRIRTGELNA
jgi:hypothetical protein